MAKRRNTWLLVAALLSVLIVVAGPSKKASAFGLNYFRCSSSSTGCFGTTATVNVRSGPGTGYQAVDLQGPGSYFDICQVMGENISGNAIWDYVGYQDGGGGLFISDYYMNTPTFGTRPEDRQYPCP
jgi:uncharacterized protein YraI